ncbi:MAG: zinc-dependent dehydrogenase [Candidatus Nitrosopelagicus sp.]|nr:zinc-dependent dehydrogenase [Candidatus Nitrosopelagicus sp.]
MKAAVVKGTSQIEVKNFETPRLSSNDILVKMQTCGICGSDVEKVFGKYGQPSMKLGHEPAGIITHVGSDVQDFKVGDRVFTHHHVACYSPDCHECSHGNETMCEKYYKSNLNPCGLSEEYVVPGWNVTHGGVLKIPDTMTFEEAAMIEPLACCVRAWSKFSYKKNDSVAILGVGPTGMMHVLLAKSAEFSKIFCLDLNDFRLDFAKKFGVITIRSDNNTLSQTILNSTEERGVDIVIVATGNLKAFSQAIQLVRKGGTIVMFGVPSKNDKIEIDMSVIYSKEISIVTTYAASDKDTRNALELISSGKIDVKSLITHKYSLNDSQKAFEHAKSGDQAMKILIEN